MLFARDRVLLERSNVSVFSRHICGAYYGSHFIRDTRNKHGDFHLILEQTHKKNRLDIVRAAK